MFLFNYVYIYDCIYDFRWWVASHALSDSKISLRQSTLDLSAENLQKMRSVFRFLMANLYDYDLSEQIHINEFKVLDRYILHLLLELCEQVSTVLL